MLVGLSPIEVNDMSFWELAAAFDGYCRAHGDSEAKELSDAEFDELAAWLDREGS